MKKFKSEKGAITLYIIMVLLFFIIAIGSVLANLKTKEYRVESEYQKIKASYYKDVNEYIIEDETVSIPSLKVIYSQGKVLSADKNTLVEDAYGNTIIVPAGFKITEDADTVPEGIVIEDGTTNSTQGTQFVWIPVGDVYITSDKEKTSENTKIVTLGRYSWGSTGRTTVQAVETKEQAITAAGTAISANSSYYEVTADNGTYGTAKGYKNAKAKDLAGFLKSAVINGGYYIGRYEAGDATATANGAARGSSSGTTGTLVCKANQQVYNYIQQTEASLLAQEMYTNSNFESDLINSYAWDTAIVFIETMPDGNSTYASMLGQSAIDTSAPKTTGTNKLEAESEENREDEQCNIYDMAGNVYEWSTETFGESTGYPCVVRGSCFMDTVNLTTSRNGQSTDVFNLKSFAFRPILYVGLDSDIETIE